jgi:serine/threonine protein kinase
MAEQRTYADFERQYKRAIVENIGEGTYGEVFKAVCATSGCWVALKRIKLDDEDEGVPSTTIREVAVLKRLQHDHVVRLLDLFCGDRQLHLVFEFVDQDLKKYMKKYNPLSAGAIKQLARQMVLGTEYCHSQGVLHRDLKPQNLLVASDGTLKLADFGLARAFQLPMPAYTHEVVTVWYRCPEILLGQKEYACPVDIWSLGCIVAELALGQACFPGDCEIDTLFRIFRRLGTPSLSQWPDLAKLPDYNPTFPQWKSVPWSSVGGVWASFGSEGVEVLDKMLVYNPAHRISARRALCLPYFDV